MTDFLDARTPSASVHALSGSTPPGAGATMQPFGVATAAVHELPDTFAPLGAVAAGVFDGLSARRAAAAHPDAAVIDLAARVKELVVREDRLLLRVIDIEDTVFKAMPPRPERAEGTLDLAYQHSVDADGTRVTVIREPAGWAAEIKANREAHEAALAERERHEQDEEARRGLPILNKLRERATARLQRWGLQLAEMEPTTQAGLAAKAAASAAVAEGDELPDGWRQTLAVSLSRDVVRNIGSDGAARAEQDRQADGELFSFVARLGPARQLADEVSAEADAAYAVWRPVWEDKPAALWERPADRHLGLPGPSGLEEDGRRWYDSEDVAKLRALRPLDQRLELNEAGEARRLDIIAAYEAWETAHKSVAETSGYNAACDRCDRVTDAMLDLEDLIHSTPALTLAGLVAKARVEVESAERREVDTVSLAFIREVARFAPFAPAQSNIRPAPLPSGVLTGRYPAGTSREDIETYRTFLDMELRYLNWEIYGQTEGRMHLWMDNPAARMHGPSQPPASSRAAAVLGLLGLTPVPGVDGRAQAEGLARAASAA